MPCVSSKFRLQHCGFDLGNGEILTNVRYADDLMLYAKHCDELVFMMEILIEEFFFFRIVCCRITSEYIENKNFDYRGFDRPYVPGCWW